MVSVETPELPASTTSLDIGLRLQRGQGLPYLHVIEWQDWHDLLFLWRSMGYVMWLGQDRFERPLLVTMIYLRPEDDSSCLLYTSRCV